MFLSLLSLGKRFLPFLLLFQAIALGASGGGPSQAEWVWAEILRGHHAQVEPTARLLLLDNPDDARAAFCLAEILHTLHRTDEARAYFDQMALRESSTGAAALGMARLEYLNRNAARGDSLLDIALDRYRSENDLYGWFVAQTELAWSVTRQGRWAEAESLFVAALKLGESREMPLTTLYARLGLGVTLKDLSRGRGRSRVEEATANLEQVINEARERDLPVWEAEAAIPLSIIYRWKNDLDTCLELRRAALAAYERVNHVPGQIDALQRVAAVLLMQNKMTEPAQLLQRAWNLATTEGLPHLSGWVVLSLGHISFETGDYARAAELFSESSRIGKETGVVELELAGLMNTGLAKSRLLLRDEALRIYEEALAKCREVQNRRGEVRILQNMGELLFFNGNTQAALQRLMEALAIAQEMGGTIGLTQHFLHRDIGFCHTRLREWAEAREAFDRALEAATAMNLAGGIQTVRWGQAQIERAQHRPLEALALLDEAMTIGEGVRARLAGASRMQSGIFSEKSILYSLAVEILYDLHEKSPSEGYDRRAFEIAQRAKARSFLDLLAEAQVDLESRADPRYHERENELLTQIAGLMDGEDGESPADSTARVAEMARLEQQLDLLETELRAADPAYAELQYPRPSTLAEIQSETLRDGELLLEYFLGDSASFVWAVTPGTFRFVRLPPQRTIEAAVRDILPMLSDYNILGPDATYFVAAAAELSRRLLEPVADELESAPRVVVAPDGILHYLPFEVLLTEASGSVSDFASLHYLVTDADISYVPSVSALARLRAFPHSSPGTKTLLLVGDPILPAADELSVLARAALGGSPTPLPHVAQEMRGLLDLFPPEQCRVISRGEATQENIRRAGDEGGYRFVHLATHGVFNERKPRYSGLVLCADSGSGDDGFLTTGEVFGLDMKCDQVVLSACSSALGERITGEGLVGLTRAFMYAGARSVVAALWEVSGQATAAFMQDFYSRLSSSEGGERAHSLAETKRRMIRDGKSLGSGGVTYAHPFFWAAFTLSGDNL